MTDKQVWILAGGNGAGKSTFFRQRLEPRGLDFINADVIAANLAPGDVEAQSYAAAFAARSLYRQYINDGRSFCYETVFSHPSKIEFVEVARKAAYHVVLVYIHLVDGLHALRVDQRVSEGGHTVDPKKILSRLPRTLQNVTVAAPLASELLVFDNSYFENPFQLVAHRCGARIEYAVDPLPDWCKGMLDGH